MLQDHNTILAYLEELARLRTQVQIWLHKDDFTPMTAKVELVNEESGQFTISSQRAVPSDLDKRWPKEMLFTLDGMRFRSPIHYVDRGGYLQTIFRVPDRVFHAERRQRMRARFGSRERARVTVLESLFRGVGVMGPLANLSLEGLCMHIERALAIPEDRRLPVNDSLFASGQELMVVRILDLPHSPMVECSGRVCHLDVDALGIRLGIMFEGLGALDSQVLSQVLLRRLPTFARGFPMKRRRSEMDLEAADRDEPHEGAEADEEAALGEPGSEASGPELVELQEPSDAEKASAGHERLLALRKRGKHILVIQVDDMNRAILAGTLQVDGYRQVREARNLMEALRAVRVSPPDLILIEQHVGRQTAQDLLDKLRKAHPEADAPVVMLAEQLDARSTIMAKVARVSRVVRFPVDYDGELKVILQELLNL